MSVSGSSNVWDRLFVGSMWPVFNFGNANDRYAKFLANAKPRFAHLIDGLLLYEKVIVPTQDFLTLTVLVGVLGERAVIDLLESEDLEFIRLRGAFGYVGGGGGLLRYEIDAKDPGTAPDPPFMEKDDAIEWSLNGLDEKVKDPALRRLASTHTTEITVESVDSVACHETYRDVMDSPYLSGLFPQGANLEKLSGIKPTQIRCYDFDDLKIDSSDPINLLLQLSTANLELKLAANSGCVDTTTVNPIGQILKGKCERSFSGQVPYESWMQLLGTASHPNIPDYVLEKPKPDRPAALMDLLRIKRTRDGAAFRRWFHENCRNDPSGVARKYIEVLQAVPAISSLPSRIVRFLVTTAVGMIPGAGAILGTGASVADSFFVERWMRGASPKFFINDLNQIVRE